MMPSPITGTLSLLTPNGTGGIQEWLLQEAAIQTFV
jgi:hypothetical protein